MLREVDKLIKKTDRPIAFVLGKYLTGGLGVVRCLGRQGIPVIWLDSGKNQIGFLSKYCIGLRCPNPKLNEEEYIDFLICIGKKLRIKGVLFPIGDIEVFTILNNKKRLIKYFHIKIADLKSTIILLDKKLFYNTLEKLKIPHPKTYFPTTIKEIISISKTIKFPCILKPQYSAEFVLIFKTKLFFVNSQKNLLDLYKKAVSNKQPVMIQEIIPGGSENMIGYNTYYDEKFDSYGDFMYQRIRDWPKNFGNGCYIKSIYNSKISKITSILIKKINYYGIVDAEFKKDIRDNSLKLIEINPRCWMQNSLPARCGFNIPYFLYKDAIDIANNKNISIYKNIKWLYFTEDFKSALESIRNKELTLKEWIKSYNGKIEYAIYAKDDPFPSLVYLPILIFCILRYLIKKR